MSSPDRQPQASTPPPGSRPRRVAALLLGLAAAAALILALRDLPRRWVEGLLADRLAAEVELGSFSIRGPRSFELGRIRVRQPALWPEIRTLRVEGLSVETGIRSALQGRYEELTFDGLEVVLAPIAGDAGRPPEPAPAVEADLVEVRRATLILDDGGHRLACDLQAVLERLGGAVAGRSRIRCPRLASAPLLAFLASRAAGDGAAPGQPAAVDLGKADLALEGFAADLLIGRRAGALEARASADRCLVGADGRLTDLGPLTARLFDEPGGPRLAIETIRPPIADAIRLEARLDATSWQWRRATATVRGLRLGAARALLPDRYPQWTAEGVADLELEAEPEAGASASAALTLRRLAHSGVEQPVRGAGLRLEATLRPAGIEPRATVWARATVPGGADRGAGRPLPAGLLPLAAEIAGEWRATPDRFDVSRLTVDAGRFGRATAAGRIREPFTAPELLADWTWTGSRLADLLAAASAWTGEALPGPTPDGTVAGRGRLAGAAEALQANGVLQFVGLALAASPPAGSDEASEAGPAWPLRAQPFEAAWTWAAPGGPVRFSVERLAATVQPAGLPELEVALAARGSIDPARGALEIDTAELAAADLGRGLLSGRLSAVGETDLRLQWTGAELPAWLAYLGLRWRGPWDDLRIHGAAEADLTLARPAAGAWRSRGSLALAGGGFEAAAGARVLDGLRVAAELDATRAADGSFDLDSRIHAGGFQLLWGTVFADYSAVAVDFDVAARGLPRPGGAPWSWQATARSKLAGDSTLAAAIRLPPEGDPRLGVELEIGELGGFLADYVQAPLAAAGPLGGLRARGRLRANLTASLADRRSAVTGRLVVQGLDYESGSGGLGVRGLDLDLPADLVWRRDEASGATLVEGPALPGQLRFAELTAAGISIAQTSTAFRVEGDSAELAASLTVPLLGGRVHLDRLTLAELLRPGRSLAAALRLEGIQLAEVSRAMDLFPLDGEASGEFPRVRLAGDALRVDGGGRISVFGGEVALRDISGSEIYSDYPRIILSADFRDIDLGRLTRKLDFGEITGTAAGHVRDLELFRGTPVRFRARLASVRRRGQPQALSLRAVGNIAQLGGGGSLGVLDQGLQRFFDRYRYRELGLAMVLDNDHFLLRGLARRGDKELFIKGRPPIRLDMVNVKPGRTVSFRTMMERLRNLEVSR